MRKTTSVLLFFSLTLCGCGPLVIFGAGTAAGVAGYKYYEGALRIIYQAPYEDTWTAAVKALENMNISISDKSKELSSGKIAARLSDGRDVKLDVKYQSAQETEVRVRVGVFGDENASMVFKEEIRKVLFP
jgi:uncharacterized lipoprotein